MPAVPSFELAAYHGIVSEFGNCVTVSHRIRVHAVFGKRDVQSTLRRVPQEGSRTDEGHFAGYRQRLTPFFQPRSNLMRVT